MGCVATAGLIRQAGLAAGLAGIIVSAAYADAPPPGQRPVSCADARWEVGINIPDETDKWTGDIKTIEALAVGPARFIIGFRYTLNDGRTYLGDQVRAKLTMDGLARMNDLVNAMSTFESNAFDPRDNGYRVYAVKWNPGAAKRFGVTVVPCIPKR